MDLIMSHINSRTFLGRTVLYRKIGNERIIHGMNVLRIKTNQVILSPIFAYYFFKTRFFKKCIDSIRKDAINQSSFALSDLKNLEIKIPTIEEQQKIVYTLQLLDKKISTNTSINDNLPWLDHSLRGAEVRHAALSALRFLYCFYVFAYIKVKL